MKLAKEKSRISQTQKEVKLPESTPLTEREHRRKDAMDGGFRLERLYELKGTGEHDINILYAISSKEDELGFSTWLEKNEGYKKGGNLENEDSSQKLLLVSKFLKEEDAKSILPKTQQREIKVTQFEIRSKRLPNGLARIEVIDRLNYTHPLIKSLTFEESKKEAAFSQMRYYNEFLPLKNYLKTLHSDALRKLKSEHPHNNIKRGLIKIDKTKKIPEETIKNIATITSSGGDLQLYAIPRENPLGGTAHICIDNETLSLLGNHPIKINGQLSSISFRYNPVSPETKGIESYMHSYFTRKTIPLINPKFIPERTNIVDLKPKISLDIGNKKLDFNDLVSEKSVPMVGKIGSYAIYSNLPREMILKGKQQLESLASGVKEAEILYTGKPGSVVKHIVVQNYFIANDQFAFVSIKEEDIVRTSELIFKNSSSVMKDTGRHEATHSIDRASMKREPLSIIKIMPSIGKNPKILSILESEDSLDNKLKKIEKIDPVIRSRIELMLEKSMGLSGAELTQSFNQLYLNDREFFKQINESEFLKMTLIGITSNDGTPGHSLDNPPEFLASFTNSLAEENFNSIMRKKTKNFRNQYIRVIEALEKNLKRFPTTVPKDAPIYQLLKRRKSYLESLNKK